MLIVAVVRCFVLLAFAVCNYGVVVVCCLLLVDSCWCLLLLAVADVLLFVV